jgi:hypothetical protein
MYTLRFFQRRQRSAFALFLTGIVLLSSGMTHKTRHLLPGDWGGDHIRLEVTGQSASIEYDCAHGTIDGPLVVDSKGKFKLSGTHVGEHGGPVRREESGNDHPASYSGWTDGKQMTLTVVLRDTKETVGTFTLTHGQEGHIRKCR